MAEHHFQREGTECIPNTILMALHLAHQTKNIKIGCGFNITPMWHPLRLAEDFATADILTGGRVAARGASAAGGDAGQASQGHGHRALPGFGKA
jgi:alkanesulfonate monooxygenase SsuD/methylene tetrahydromethanopterin reductase-like flavin-dependent oxidoreductase (luciferase family)